MSKHSISDFKINEVKEYASLYSINKKGVESGLL